MISTAGIKSPIEKYVGNNIYNRMSFKLKKQRVLNPPEMWIRSDAVFESIVPAELFTRAHNIIRERSRKYSNDELLGQPRSLLEREGRLSGLLIDETDGNGFQFGLSRPGFAA